MSRKAQRTSEEQVVAEGRANKTSEAKAKARKAQMLTWNRRRGTKERTGGMDEAGALLAKARKARRGGPRSEEMCRGD